MKKSQVWLAFAASCAAFSTNPAADADQLTDEYGDRFGFDHEQAGDDGWIDLRNATPDADSAIDVMDYAGYVLLSVNSNTVYMDGNERNPSIKWRYSK